MQTHWVAPEAEALPLRSGNVWALTCKAKPDTLIIWACESYYAIRIGLQIYRVRALRLNSPVSESRVGWKSATPIPAVAPVGRHLGTRSAYTRVPHTAVYITPLWGGFLDCSATQEVANTERYVFGKLSERCFPTPTPTFF